MGGSGSFGYCEEVEIVLSFSSIMLTWVFLFPVWDRTMGGSGIVRWFFRGFFLESGNHDDHIPVIYSSCGVAHIFGHMYALVIRYYFRLLFTKCFPVQFFRS